jgi:hypothetical protein
MRCATRLLFAIPVRIARRLVVAPARRLLAEIDQGWQKRLVRMLLMLRMIVKTVFEMVFAGMITLGLAWAASEVILTQPEAKPPNSFAAFRRRRLG